MKLLFFVHSLAGGGAERVCSTLVNEFAKRGEDVYIAYNMNSDDAYEIDDRVRKIDLSEGTRSVSFWSKFLLYRFLRTLMNMRKCAKVIRPDFAVCIMTDYGLFALMSLIGLKIPIIVSEHTTVGRMPREYKLFYNFLYPFAAAVTVLTKHDFKIWDKKFSNVVRMPNPLTPAEGHPVDERNKWVLGVGRVGSPEKGFDSMVKCWNMIYKKHPGWKLVIAGKCDDEDIKSLCEHLDDGVNSQIEFLGFRKDVYNVMLQSEVFVLSSRYEGLPMGLMEAMSAGCCCVAFDVVTGPSDIIHNNKSGLLVENQNIEALAKSVDKVITDDDLRVKLSSNAHLEVERFSIERIMNRWYLLFKQIDKHHKKN